MNTSPQSKLIAEFFTISVAQASGHKVDRQPERRYGNKMKLTLNS